MILLFVPRAEDEIISRYGVMVQPPGHFDYSNLGYGILDKIIRNASGKSYSDFLKQDLFLPLGMKDSYVLEDTGNPDEAVWYAGDDGRRIDPGRYYTYSAGASSLYSSVHDLALFSMFHLKALKNKSKVLSTASIDQMQDTTARSGVNQYYGLGWWINTDYYGYKGVLAQGGNYFASTWMQLIPTENVAVIVLTNIGYGEPWRKIINEAMAAVLPKFKENLVAAQTAIVKEKPAPAPVTAEPGKWEGVVHAYKRDIPFQFSYSSAGECFAKLDTGSLVHIDKPRVRPNSFAVTMPGDLFLEDLGPGPYNLNFYLTREDDIIYRSLQITASVHPATPRLSYAVELRKVSK